MPETNFSRNIARKSLLCSVFLGQAMTTLYGRHGQSEALKFILLALGTFIFYKNKR